DARRLAGRRRRPLAGRAERRRGARPLAGLERRRRCRDHRADRRPGAQLPIDPKFLTALRELTRQHGVVLIFDEVVTGFRVSPGGAQAEYGIRPDLTTLAKILAGGLPGGAVAGRKDILDLLDFQITKASDREKITHQGTFNANPLSAAAGVAALEIV